VTLSNACGPYASPFRLRSSLRPGTSVPTSITGRTGPLNLLSSSVPPAAIGVHVVGVFAPIVEGYIGCIVIRPDGSGYLARAVPDPLAQ
jgi:hypothetical protein